LTYSIPGEVSAVDVLQLLLPYSLEGEDVWDGQSWDIPVPVLYSSTARIGLLITGTVAAPASNLDYYLAGELVGCLLPGADCKGLAWSVRQSASVWAG
jgi:hypothetical protein